MDTKRRFCLHGKRALITGGSKGLGFAMATALAEFGAGVVLVSRDEANLSDAAARLRSIGGSVDVIAADLSDPLAAEEMCRGALTSVGDVDILINNVGGRVQDVPITEQDVSDWNGLMDLNLTSAFVCTKVLGKPMLDRRWGRVINIGSMSAQVSTRNIGGRHYETAKAALVGFTRTVAADWAPYNVTVNCIAPGPFMTDANRSWFERKPALQAEIEASIPMGRMGAPDEIGGLAVFLASDASSFVTGATILIDGGYTLW